MIVASAVFFAVAILRSAALGYLLSVRRTAMDDVDGQLAAYAVRCREHACMIHPQHRVWVLRPFRA